jgi:transcriptional regulator of acetoin/glycerol metabolism
VESDMSRQELLDLLRSCEWDTAEAGRRLGVHRVTIYRRMQRLAIRRPKGRRQPQPS